MNKLILIAVLCLLAVAAARNLKYQPQKYMKSAYNEDAINPGSDLVNGLRRFKRQPRPNQICIPGYYYDRRYDACVPCQGYQDSNSGVRCKY